MGSETLHFGRDARTGVAQSVSVDLLRTGLHVLGPPGAGKTNLIFYLYRQLCAPRDGAVIVFTNKGNLIPTCRNWAIDNGQASRLVIFDPGNPDWVTGWDPLKPNGVSVADHARQVREGFRAGVGQTNFDATQQLARFSYAVFYALRERELTLDCATALLRPRSPLLAEILPSIHDPEVKADLALLQSLPPARQEELGASTLARLLGLVAYPRMRRILNQRGHSIDLDAVLRDRKILLVNIEQDRPLSADDVRLLGRMFLNDLLRAVFRRRNLTPVTLIIDEAQVWVTHDLCRALEQGRELNLRTILAHHHLEQLRLEADDRRLLEAVLQCAMTKILFGGGWVPNYSPFLAHFFIDQFHPLTVKHQETRLESEYIETTRTIRTRSTSRTMTKGLALPSQRADHYGASSNVSHTLGDSRGESDIVTDSTSRSEGTTVLPDGTVLPSESTGEATSVGVVAQRTSSRSKTIGEGATRGWSRSTGRVPSMSRSRSISESEAEHPFHEIRQRRVPSGTTFWTLDEFYTKRLQELAALPVGECCLKRPGSPAVILDIPRVKHPEIGRARLHRVLDDRVYGGGGYALRVVEREAMDRPPAVSAEQRTPRTARRPRTKGREN